MVQPDRPGGVAGQWRRAASCPRAVLGPRRGVASPLVALEELPTGGSTGTYDAPGTGLEPDGPGWAVAGTVGAAAWGAPVVVGSNYPPDFYVLTTAELRQATLRLGEASRFEDRACTVAVAPTPLVCVDRFPRSDDWGQWSFAHGLFAALDLAQDRARGAEILESWNPTEFARVW
jgi:hypothetical protein